MGMPKEPVRSKLVGQLWGFVEQQEFEPEVNFAGNELFGSLATVS